MDRPTRVFVVDDHDAYRRVAAAVVEATPGFAWAGDAAEPDAALDRIAGTDPLPDLVLVDVNLGPRSGLDLAGRLAACHPSLRVALISTLSADELPPEALSCGAVAYLSKSDLEPTTLRGLAAGLYDWPR